MNNENIIYFDHRAFEEEKATLEEAQQLLQQGLDAFNGLELDDPKPQIKGLEGLLRFVRDPENQLKELLKEAAEPPRIMGMKVSKAKAVDLLELPDLSTIEQAGMKLGPSHEALARRELELRGQYVKMKKGAMDRLEARNSLTAETEEERALLEELRKLCEQLEKVQEKAAPTGKKLIGRNAEFTHQRAHRLDDWILFKDGKAIPKAEAFREIRELKKKRKQQK